MGQLATATTVAAVLHLKPKSSADTADAAAAAHLCAAKTNSALAKSVVWQATNVA